MITPADLARMLKRADDSAGNHTQNGLEQDVLLYTSVSSGVPGASGRRTHESTGMRGVGSDGEDDAEDDGAADAGLSVRVADIIADMLPPDDGAAHITSIERSGNTLSAVITPAVMARVTRGAHRSPTPAMMPRRRSSDGPTTFASLDAQELPVVREYSAGGLVFDETGRVAIIARHSRSGHLEWCLPKGHIEKGETPQQTAVREVHEETGILGEVVESIATIDYWFTGTTQRVHKLVHHFALKRIGGELTVEGDPDHEAEDAIWVDFNDLDDVLSYPNERKIAWLYARKLNRQADE